MLHNKNEADNANAVWGGEHQNSSKRIIVRCFKLLNVALNFALFCFCWHAFYSTVYLSAPSVYQSAALFAVYLILLILLDRIYNAFDVGLLRISELVYANTLSTLMAALIVYGLTALTSCSIPRIFPLLLLLASQFAWHCLWAYAANCIYFKLHAPKRTVVVFRNQNDLKKLKLLSRYTRRFSVEKYVENPKSFHQLIQDINGYEVVFAVGLSATLRNGLVKHCVESDIQGYIEPKVGDIIMAGAKEIQSFSIPILHVGKATPLPEYLLLKRLVDIVVSAAMLLITWPIMLVIVIGIKAYDRGPALYKQTRLTKDGRIFEMLKFRSMKMDAEKDGVARLSTGKKDDRVTPIGKFIRSYRLDELPQLLNILRGDMTLVGPRPERPEIAEKYEKNIPAFRMRLQVKAGLTGYAQIYGRYNSEPYDKLQMDLMYINRMSLAEDIRLMLATIKILFIKESTEGVEEPHDTESDASNNRSDIAI